MKPSEIFYSQDSIKDKFENGRTIISTFNVCVKYPYVINRIPIMRVFKKDGKWFSMDNRRLWVFKKLEAEGHIKDVTVRHTSRDKLPDDKFTTQNGGVDVSIRDTTAFSFRDSDDSNSDDSDRDFF